MDCKVLHLSLCSASPVTRQTGTLQIRTSRTCVLMCSRQLPYRLQTRPEMRQTRELYSPDSTARVDRGARCWRRIVCGVCFRGHMDICIASYVCTYGIKTRTGRTEAGTGLVRACQVRMGAFSLAIFSSSGCVKRFGASVQPVL